MVNIEGIAIRGFRSIDNIDLELDGGGAFITGMNGAGKTSVLEAIRFALLGYCQNTDRRGARAKTLIADGADEAVIDIELTGDHDPQSVRVRVVIPIAGAVRWSAEDYETGKPVAAKPEQLWPWIGVSEATLAAALVPAEHVTTQGMEGVLGELHSGQVDLEELESLCGERYARLLVDYPGISGGTNQNALRHIGDEAYAQRREAGRVVKQLEAALNGEKPEPPVNKSGKPLGLDDKDDLVALEQKLTSNREALLEELGQAKASAQSDMPAGSMEDLQKALETAVDESDKAKRDAAAARVTREDAINHQRNLEDQLRTLQSEIAEKQKEFDSLGRQMQQFQPGETCPTCGVKWTESRVNKAVAKLKGQRASLHGPLEDAKAKLAKIETAINQAMQRVKTADEKLAKATDAMREADARMAKAHGDMALLEKTSGARSVAEVEKDIEAVTERLNKASGALEALGALARYEKAASELEAARERYNELDWRVKAFRDGEVLNKLSGDGLEEFKATVNAVLDPFGYAFGFSVDGKFVNVLLGRLGDKDLRLIERASSGERKLAEVAVAIAFGKEAGLALVDDLDHLDGRNRNQALTGIATTPGVQIIAAGAWGKPNKPDLKPIEKALKPLKPVWIDGNGEGNQQEEAA